MAYAGGGLRYGEILAVCSSGLTLTEEDTLLSSPQGLLSSDKKRATSPRPMLTKGMQRNTKRRLLENVFGSCISHIVTFPNPYTGGKSSNTVYLARM